MTPEGSEHPSETASADEPALEAAADEVSGEIAPRSSSLGAISKRFAGIFRRREGSKAESEADRSDAAMSGTQDTADGFVTPFANAVDFNPLPRQEEDGSISSDEIFEEIGRQLRARREMLNLTHEEIERHIRVRVAFLKAMEQGSMEDLPSPVQTRGIMANYAAFIDLDVDALLLRFADGIQARHREQRPNWPPRSRAPMTVHSNLPPFRTFIASDLLFGGGAAIMLFLFAIWGINRVLVERAASPENASAPSISDVLAEAPLPTVPSEVTLIPAADTPLSPPTVATQEAQPSPVDPSITVQVKLRASERTYMRILVDDKPAFEGRAEPGKDYYYQAARQIEVLAGNAAALSVTHNGRDLGQMGNYGEVVNEYFTARGVLTPTATLPPTRTPTATTTLTPAPTPTLATYTPTPKSGQ
jgi:cytoskeleton protein RodZ